MKNHHAPERFLVDFMLGRLCRWLRILGEDAAFFRENYEKGGILYRSLRERRVIITRNRKLSPGKAYGLCLVYSCDFREQLREVMERFSITVSPERLFTRCPGCNIILEPAERRAVKGKVPGYVYEAGKSFSVCAGCGKVYWPGTHRELAGKVLLSVTDT